MRTERAWKGGRVKDVFASFARTGETAGGQEVQGEVGRGKCDGAARCSPQPCVSPTPCCQSQLPANVMCIRHKICPWGDS